MSARMDRGQSSSQVSSWMPSENNFTPINQSSFRAPFGLQLRQTISTAGVNSVTIPAGVNWVYVILAGPGGYGNSGGGGAGGIAWGWTLAQNTCVVGNGTQTSQEYTRYGHIIAGQGGANGLTNPSTGSGGRPDQTVGSTNYWGIPGGIVAGGTGSGASGGSTTTNGGNGISGGGGNSSATTNGFSGGSGIAGGGGGGGASGFSGGTGGSGIGVDGTVYTGGSSNGRNAGGGAGIAANGGNATASAGGTGGLGGGGGGGTGTGGGSPGGNGIIYLYY